MRSNIRRLIGLAAILFSMAVAKLPRARRGFFVIALTGGAFLGFVLLGGWHEQQISAAEMSRVAIQNVTVTSPQLVMSRNEVDLSAEVRPWQDAGIYSRVNGYLKSWLVDVGEHVEAGQLLAEGAIPDLPQKLDQAQFQAVLAQHILLLAKDKNTKWQQLFKQGVVSRLEAENTAASEGDEPG